MDNHIRQSWWKRNWKWALPTGGCLTLIIIAVAFISYGAYQIADKLSEETSVFALLGVIQEVQKSPEVKEALGTPLRFEGLEDENYKPDNSKHLNLDFEIQGNKSDGQLRVLANKTADGWYYETFSITVEKTGEVIHLKDRANE